MQISLRGPAGRVHDFVTIRPSNHQKVADHLTTESKTDPFVHNGYNEFTDELGGLAGLSGRRKDESVSDIVDWFEEAVEVDALVRIVYRLGDNCSS